MTPQEDKYQRFSKYLRFTTNAQWKNILSAMAKGKFPQGFKLSSSGNAIISKDDGRKLRLENDEDEKDPKVLTNNFCKIRNFIDVPDADLSSSVGEQDQTINSWKEIKSKETKNHLLSLFSGSLAGERHLNPQQQQKIAHQLALCVQLKSFSAEDIIMKKGKIESIEGLVITKNGEVKMPQIKASKKSTSAKKKKNIVRLHIEKMIKENDFRLTDLSGMDKEE